MDATVHLYEPSIVAGQLTEVTAAAQEFESGDSCSGEAAALLTDAVTFADRNNSRGLSGDASNPKFR
jgi:hypothetical protein